VNAARKTTSKNQLLEGKTPWNGHLLHVHTTPQVHWPYAGKIDLSRVKLIRLLLAGMFSTHFEFYQYHANSLYNCNKTEYILRWLLAKKAQCRQTTFSRLRHFTFLSNRWCGTKQVAINFPKHWREWRNGKDAKEYLETFLT